MGKLAKEPNATSGTRDVQNIETRHIDNVSLHRLNVSPCPKNPRFFLTEKSSSCRFFLLFLLPLLCIFGQDCIPPLGQFLPHRCHLLGCFAIRSIGPTRQHPLESNPQQQKTHHNATKMSKIDYGPQKKYQKKNKKKSQKKQKTPKKRKKNI